MTTNSIPYSASEFPIIETREDLLRTLLTDPAKVAALCSAHSQLPARAMPVVVLGTAIFGGAVGVFRGGWQILWGALKMPLVFLLALMITVPAVFLFGRLRGAQWSYQTVATACLVAMARCALVMLAFSPFFWASISIFSDPMTAYGVARIAFGGTTLLALLSGVPVFFFSIDRIDQRWQVTAFAICVFVLATAQCAWVFAPFLVSPNLQHTPFLHAIDHRTAIGAMVDTFLRALGQGNANQ